MFSLSLVVAPEQEDQLIADLAELGTTGITEEHGGLRAFFDDTSDRPSLLMRLAAFVPEAREEEATDWEQVSRDAFPPLLVGQRFYLIPPWRQDEPTPPGRLRLEISPGMACGTGRHPATQLCLQAIERYVREGHRVADVGTGSGILARASLLMGAERVAACDTDPDAVQIARASMDSDAPTLFVGSLDAVCSGWADIIIANIDAGTIERLAKDLQRVRKPVSTVILSGFPADDIPEGFQPKETLRQDEWLCFIL